MPRTESTYRPQAHGRPAHDLVSADAAADVHARDGVDWSVSGDATAVGYGTIGNRRHAHAVDVWHGPGVSRRLIGDVSRGDVITTWQGRGVVTRIGSIAGFFMVDGAEVRWIAADIERIERPTVGHVNERNAS